MRTRIRTVKPEVHTDEVLWDLEVDTGLPVFRCFIGLWNVSDREGRFEWRPRALKSHILPYWEGEFSRVLDALASRGFVRKYTSDGREYGLVRTFKDHQAINNKEEQSKLPPPPETFDDTDTCTREPRDDDASGSPLGSTRVERNRTEPIRTEGNARPTREATSAQSKLDRARALLRSGYAERYAAAGAGVWMSWNASREWIGIVAAWCAAEGDLEANARDVLDGAFADPWLNGKDEKGEHRRWPWKAIANDPGKLAEAARSARAKAARVARIAEAEREREREERERDRATEDEAMSPEEVRELIATELRRAAP